MPRRRGVLALCLLLSWPATVTLAAGPALAGELAFVTNQSSDDLSIIDLAGMETLATVAIGGKPAGVAAGPDGRVYVTSPESKTLSVIDVASRARVAEIALEGGPLGVAVHPSGAPVYVADWYEHRILVVDPDVVAGGSAGMIVARVQVGQSPSGLAVSPDGTLLVSADRDDHQLSLIDTETLAVVATVTVGERPFGVTLDAAGRRAFTANVGSNDVSVVDLARRETVATVPTGERPYAVALANGRGFVTDQYAGTITVFDAETYRPLERVTAGEYPEGIWPGRAGRFVYFVNWFDNTLMKLDAASLEIVEEAETGDGPRAFGVFITEDR